MRQEIPIIVLGADGRPVAGASVYVRTDPGGADATIYQAKTGGATHPNPRTSDAQGRVEGWLDRNDYAATVSGVPGLPPWVESFPIASAADGAIDNLWLPDDVITARTIADAAVGRGALDADVVREHPAGLLTPAQFLALPAQMDGTVVRVQADANGVNWRLRLNKASASTYKWEIDGSGRPLRGILDTLQSIVAAAGAWQEAFGPEVVIPLAGEYDFEWQAQCNSAGASCIMTIGVGTGTAVLTPVNGTAPLAVGTAVPNGQNVYGLRGGDRYAITPAGTAIRVKYSSQNTGINAQVQLRRLFATPVRVAGPAAL